MEIILNQILEELKTLNTRVGCLEEGQQSLEKGQQSLESGQQSLFKGLQSLEKAHNSLAAEMQAGFDGVNKKLDTIYAEVAHNTEQEVKLNEVISKVNDLETDNKLIKKVITTSK